MRPVSISYKTQPNAQISVRLSTVCPRACSGLMYAAVPRMTPSCVPLTVTAGDCARSCDSVARDCLGQAEVEHLDDAVGRDLDVGRLQVPVDDPSRVRGLQRIGNLPGDPE